VEVVGVSGEDILAEAVTVIVPVVCVLVNVNNSGICVLVVPAVVGGFEEAEVDVEAEADVAFPTLSVEERLLGNAVHRFPPMEVQKAPLGRLDIATRPQLEDFLSLSYIIEKEKSRKRITQDDAVMKASGDAGGGCQPGDGCQQSSA
jgi:hypothetical protein